MLAMKQNQKILPALVLVVVKTSKFAFPRLPKSVTTNQASFHRGVEYSGGIEFETNANTTEMNYFGTRKRA